MRPAIFKRLRIQVTIGEPHGKIIIMHWRSAAFSRCLPATAWFYSPFYHDAFYKARSS